MSVEKSFPVFGELVEVLVSPATSNGTLGVVTQTCLPGGGPPPHMHVYEDEFFVPVFGDFEMFDGSSWTPLTSEGAFSARGSVHTFRNCGTGVAKIMCMATPGALPTYLELISTCNLPEDMERLVEISNEYGITFVQSAVPELAGA